MSDVREPLLDDVDLLVDEVLARHESQLLEAYHNPNINFMDTLNGIVNQSFPPDVPMRTSP